MCNHTLSRLPPEIWHLILQFKTATFEKHVEFIRSLKLIHLRRHYFQHYHQHAITVVSGKHRWKLRFHKWSIRIDRVVLFDFDLPLHSFLMEPPDMFHEILDL